MPRTLTSPMSAAFLADNVRPISLIELYFDSGTVYHTHAPYDMTWNGNVYSSVHGFATIDPIQESSQMEANGLTGTLVADSVNMGIALNESIQGRKVIVRLAMLDGNHQIIADPIISFQGRMDTMSIELGDKATIKLTAESRFASWDTPRIRRWNHEDQVAIHPNDLFFEFVPQMVERTLLWGVAGTPPKIDVTSALVSAAFGGGSGGFFSDRRLKSDIVRIGEYENGIPKYSFKFKCSDVECIGAMADEVELVIPAAVLMHESGYKMVQYGMFK